MNTPAEWVGSVPEEHGSQDEIFEALADTQRRRLLVFLLHHDSQYVAELSDVSSELAEMHQTLLRRYLSGPYEVAGSDKELLQMHHVHLPKLAAYDFIDWNRENNLVTKGDRFDEMKPFLKLVESY